MNIEYTKKPATSDIDFLTKKINQETSEYGEAYPFAFFMRDERGEIIAGANGFIIYGAIYTDQLWVDKNIEDKDLLKKSWIKYMSLANWKDAKLPLCKR